MRAIWRQWSTLVVYYTLTLIQIMVYIVQVNVMITVSTVRQSLSVKFVNLDFTVTGVIIIVIHDV